MNIKIFIKTIFKTTALVLALALLMPYGIKLTHALNHENHKVCNNEDSSTHYHELDLDCEFYKFHYNITKFKTNQAYDTIIPLVIVLKPFTDYKYSANNHKQLTAYLRGPPFTV